jgi:hypothetical protein
MLKILCTGTFFYDGDAQDYESLLLTEESETIRSDKIIAPYS